MQENEEEFQIDNTEIDKWDLIMANILIIS